MILCKNITIMTEAIFISYCLLLWLHVCVGNDLSSLPGHNQRFGTGKQSQDTVDISSEFPQVHDFFRNYVLESKPLKMEGVVSSSVPCKKWTDEYFLSMDLSGEEDVLVETKKKENRKQPATTMDFKKFIRTYQTTDHYMVQTIPKFLGRDIVIPYPLQCDQIYNGNIVESIMWFSSGGTKSVVHTDSVENLNCLYHGQKEFILVNPHKFGEKVDIDHPEGAYSDIDVDKVDYNKYPDLAEVEFMSVNMTAGDCLYIPYKWIHQVRSYHRNIAVNIWWDHHASENINLDMCPYATMDHSLTMDKVVFQGLGQNSLSTPAMRDFFTDLTKKGPIVVDDFFDIMLRDAPVFEEVAGNEHKIYLQKIAARLDTDGDDHFSPEEIAAATEEDWEFVKEQVNILEDLAEDMEDEWSDVNNLPVEELYEKYEQQDVTPEEDTQEEEVHFGQKSMSPENPREEVDKGRNRVDSQLHREEDIVNLEYDSVLEGDEDLRVWDYESDDANEFGNHEEL